MYMRPQNAQATNTIIREKTVQLRMGERQRAKMECTLKYYVRRNYS